MPWPAPINCESDWWVYFGLSRNAQPLSRDLRASLEKLTFLALLKLPLAFALVSRFGLGQLVTQGLRGPFLRLLLRAFPLFIAEMHKDAPQPEADRATDGQKNDA